MDIQAAIRRIEDGLRNKGRSVDEFCRMAGVHRTTWQRWKAGSIPSLRMWNRVLEAERSFRESAAA